MLRFLSCTPAEHERCFLDTESQGSQPPRLLIWPHSTCSISDCTEHTKQVPASGHLNWWFLISVISTRRVLWLYMGLDSKDTLPKKPSLVTVFYTVRFSLPGPCHTLFHYSFSFIYFHRTHLYLFNATAPPATLSPSRTGPTARFYIPRMLLELVDI